jgi:hypothetical protein
MTGREVSTGSPGPRRAPKLARFGIAHRNAGAQLEDGEIGAPPAAPFPAAPVSAAAARHALDLGADQPFHQAR